MLKRLAGRNGNIAQCGKRVNDYPAKKELSQTCHAEI
jgi:hypothetical protein